MTTENLRAMEFTATPGTYMLAPDADNDNVVNQISWKASHLTAMLNFCIGEGFERFNCMSNEMQEDYLAACTSAAAEIKALAHHI